MAEVDIADWTRRAACKSTQDGWYRDSTKAAKREALRLCAECSVRLECGAEALMVKDDYAIRAGYKMWQPGERARLRLELGVSPPCPSGPVATSRACEDCGAEFDAAAPFARCRPCQRDEVSSDAAIAHVRRLREEYGYTVAQLSVISEVPRATIHSMINKRRYISRAVSEALLAIEVPDAPVAPPSFPKVRIEVVRAHVKRLRAAKMLDREIAAEAGIPPGTVATAMYSNQTFVTAATATALLGVEVPQEGRAL